MALQGTLDTFSLPDVLRLLAGTAKTGRLRLDGDRGHGSVWLRDGAVVASRADRALDGAPNEEVVFELLRFESGSFAFDTGDETDDAGKPEDVDGLLRRAGALLSEWNELEVVVPSLDHRVRLSDDLASDEVTIDADRWRSVVAVASGRSVSELATQLGLSELGVSRVVRDLVDLGVAEVAEPDKRRRDTGTAQTRPLRRSEGSGLLGRRASRSRIDEAVPPVVPADSTPAAGTQRAGWLQPDTASEQAVPGEPDPGAASDGPAPLVAGHDRPVDREPTGGNGGRGSRRGRAGPVEGDRASQSSAADGQPPTARERPSRSLASRRTRDRPPQPPSGAPVPEAAAGPSALGPRPTPAGPPHGPAGVPHAPAGPSPAGPPLAPAGPPPARSGPPGAPAGPQRAPARPAPAGPPPSGGPPRGRGPARDPSRRGHGRPGSGEPGPGLPPSPFDTGRSPRPRLSDTGRIRALTSSAMPADLRWAADDAPGAPPRPSHPFSGVNSLGAPRIGDGGPPFGEGEVAAHVTAMSPEARAAVEATIGPAGGAQRGPGPGDDVAQRGRLVDFLSSIRN